MTVSGVSGSSSSTSSSVISSSTIAGNFDTFLSLLTTQLKNQNPLSPLDTNQFTSQLVQFSSVEQQLKTNSFLQSMMEASQTSTNTNAVSYIGKTITASGNTAALSKGSAVWNFSLPAAADVSVNIKDSTGAVVFSQSSSVPAGANQFAWDGMGSDGKSNSDGDYTISITAKDKSGGYVAASTDAAGKVSGVDLSGASPMLIVGNSRISIKNVTSVMTPGA
jgi:flagellar basal-body rod modification protein FlgD